MNVAIGLRLLRLPRVAFSLNRTNVIFNHMLRSLPSFLGLFGLILTLFTLYAQLGVALFGGKIRTDEWAKHADEVGLPLPARTSLCARSPPRTLLESAHRLSFLLHVVMP